MGGVGGGVPGKSVSRLPELLSSPLLATPSCCPAAPGRGCCSQAGLGTLQTIQAIVFAFLTEATWGGKFALLSTNV